MTNGRFLLYRSPLLVMVMSFKFSVCLPSNFVLVPTIIRPIVNSYQARLSAPSFDQCTPLINEETVAISFNPSSNVCTSYVKLAGYNQQDTGILFYIRLANPCGKCGSSAAVKSALINYIYGNNICVDTIFTYDPETKYCYVDSRLQTKNSNLNYSSSYAQSGTVGVLRNYTLLTLSRAQATEALNYKCPYPNSTITTFDGVWYCYTIFSVTAANTRLIVGNACNDWIAGSTVIKYIHPAEPGRVSNIVGTNAYVGIWHYGTGTSTASYRFYDNTTIGAEYNYWRNAPTGQPLAYLGNDLLLYNYDASKMTKLMCRSIAVPI